MPFFWKRKKQPPPETLARDLDNRLQELTARFRHIEEALERLSTKSTQITIENVHIHQPVLEKLEYRLDALDIEHLSGSLNLGNNFGTPLGPDLPLAKTQQQRSKKQASPSTGETDSFSEEQPSSAPGTGLQSTPTGYRIRPK